MRWSSVSTALGTWSALSVAKAAASDAYSYTYDPINDFCQRFSHQTAVSRNRLYIDGGLVDVSNHNFNVDNFTNTKLLFHDLSTTKRNGEELKLPPLETNLTKPTDVPSLRGGYLWPDEINGKIYQYGGEWYTDAGDPKALEMWVYDEYNDSWSSMSVETDISRVSYGAGTTVSYSGYGFYMGGWINEQSDPSWNGSRMATNGLIKYDFVNNLWSNITGPDDNEGRGGGVLFNVPVGDGGLLVYIGGQRQVQNGSKTSTTYGSMDSLDIYDIVNNKWYTQNATGDIPSPRYRFCGGIVSAEDGSSHNVYIYGGLGFGSNSTGFDDAYVLSMPSFTWTKIYGAADAADAYPKYDMSCNVVQNGSQMIVIGGQYSKSGQKNSCDVPTGAGVHNLNLGMDDGLYWQGYNDTLEGYDVPVNVTKTIGGSSTGGATATAPSSWGHPDLKVLFGRTLSIPDRQPTRSVPPAFGGPSPKSSSHTTTIVAAVVPTVVGVALIVGAGLFFWRRNKARKAAVPTFEDPKGPMSPVYGQDGQEAAAGWHPMSPSPPYEAHDHYQEMGQPMLKPNGQGYTPGYTQPHGNEAYELSSTAMGPAELPSDTQTYEADSAAISHPDDSHHAGPSHPDDAHHAGPSTAT